MSKLVCDLPEGIDTRIQEVIVKLGMNEFPVKCKIAEVKVKKTKEEKDRAKRLYRKEYSKRPLVQEKIKARLSNPEVIAKRKAYSEREDVKKRKKEIAARNRMIRNVLKYENSDLYKEIVNKIETVPTNSSVFEGG